VLPVILRKICCLLRLLPLLANALPRIGPQLSTLPKSIL
jgi:hypothetical protein